MNRPSVAQRKKLALADYLNNTNANDIISDRVRTNNISCFKGFVLTYSIEFIVYTKEELAEGEGADYDYVEHEFNGEIFFIIP